MIQSLGKLRLTNIIATVMETPKCSCKQLCYYACINQKCKEPNPFICKQKRYQCLKPHQSCSLKLYSKFAIQIKNKKNYADTAQKFQRLMAQVEKVIQIWQGQVEKAKTLYNEWKQNIEAVYKITKIDKIIKENREGKITGSHLYYMLNEPNYCRYKIQNKEKQIQLLIPRIQDISHSIENLYQNIEKQTSILSDNKSVISTNKSIKSRISRLQRTPSQKNGSMIKDESIQPISKKHSLQRRLTKNQQVKKNKQDFELFSQEAFSPRNKDIYPIQEEREQIKPSWNTIKAIVKKFPRMSERKSVDEQIVPFGHEQKMLMSQSAKVLESFRSPEPKAEKIIEKMPEKNVKNFPKMQNVIQKIKMTHSNEIVKKLKSIKTVPNTLDIKFAFFGSSEKKDMLKSQSAYNQQKFLELAECFRESKFQKIKKLTIYFPHCITEENRKQHQSLARILYRLPNLQNITIVITNKGLENKAYQCLGNRAEFRVQNNWILKQQWE